LPSFNGIIQRDDVMGNRIMEGTIFCALLIFYIGVIGLVWVFLGFEAMVVGALAALLANLSMIER